MLQQHTPVIEVEVEVEVERESEIAVAPVSFVRISSAGENITDITMIHIYTEASHLSPPQSDQVGHLELEYK